MFIAGSLVKVALRRSAMYFAYNSLSSKFATISKTLHSSGVRPLAARRDYKHPTPPE